MALVGNKCDVALTERKVAISNARSVAEKNCMTFKETSAKTGIGVNELFTEIAELIYQKKSGK